MAAEFNFKISIMEILNIKTTWGGGGCCYTSHSRFGHHQVLYAHCRHQRNCTVGPDSIFFEIEFVDPDIAILSIYALQTGLVSVKSIMNRH